MEARQKSQFTCDFCVRRLPADGTMVPKHVGSKIFKNCLLWFAIHCILLCAFVIPYIEYTEMHGKCRDSSVGIATRYGLDGPGIESCRSEISASIQTGPGAYPASYTTGTGSFPGVKRPRLGVDHPPPSSAKAKESRPLWAYKACCRANITLWVT
jgi:hypothetical protein